MHSDPVVFYVSGHGFGHATRSAESILAMCRRGLKVTVVSSAPSFLFSEILEKHGNLAELREAFVDCGVIQADAVSVDVGETMTRLREFMADAEEKIEQEALWLRNRGAKLVLADASFVPCAAAKRAGVPSAFVSNFTWDSILEGYADTSASEQATKDEAILRRVFDLCKQADYLLRMPGWIDVPAFPNPETNENVFDTPLVVRRHRKSRAQVRQQLGLTEEDKVVLISFGGHFLEGSWSERNFLPSGWVGLICGPGRDVHSDVGTSGSRLVTIPMGQAYVPDLANAADVVLGKLGFGTCSEVIDAGVPFVYVSRVGFVEEEGLLRLMLDCNPEESVVEMSGEDFRNGNWKEYLLQVVDKRKNAPRVKIGTDGDEWIAGWAADFVANGGPKKTK